MDKTPNQYIQWRYATGEDREGADSVFRKATKEEEEKMAAAIKMADGTKKVPASPTACPQLDAPSSDILQRIPARDTSASPPRGGWGGVAWGYLADLPSLVFCGAQPIKR